jgi:ATP-dependent 26S proteasome regulatory subunit
MTQTEALKSYREDDANHGAASRLLELLRATEPGIIIETAEPTDTTNEIVKMAISESARNIAPKWCNTRPEVVVTTFASYPQEHRLVLGQQNTRADGGTGHTFTTPIEGNGDYDPLHHHLVKVMPYGDPIDCSPDVLEAIPKSRYKVMGATQQAKFRAKASAETICMTLLESIDNFDSQKNGRGRIYIIQAADNFLSLKTFTEMLRERIDRVRNVHVTGIGIVLLVPPGFDKTPDALKESMFTLKWNRPNKSYWRGQITDIVDARQMKMDQDKQGNPIAGVSPAELERCTSALVGMTRARGEAAILICATKQNKIVPETILKEKASQIQDYGLNLISPNPDEEIGGLDNFQQWLTEEVAASTPEAIAFGLKGGRMVLLAGPPGTGKSLGAKVLANKTGRPLIRLGATDIQKKYVGEGPALLKMAFDLAGNMDGIIQIDEVEKLVQNTSAERDGGSSASILSMLLTEIQENESNIMFVFTANRVEMLPPEFIDRASSRFMFDYPNREEQLAILRIAVARFRVYDRDNPAADAKGYVRRNPDDYPLEQLLKYTDGANGRQLANAVIQSFKIAFTRHHGEPELEDFIEGINRNSMNSTPEKELELIRDNCLARGFTRANSQTEEESTEVDYSGVGITGRS